MRTAGKLFEMTEKLLITNCSHYFTKMSTHAIIWYFEYLSSIYTRIFKDMFWGWNGLVHTFSHWLRSPKRCACVEILANIHLNLNHGPLLYIQVLVYMFIWLKYFIHYTTSWGILFLLGTCCCESPIFIYISAWVS